MYPVYMIRAAIKNPDTLLAPLNVLNAAPIARNRAVIHIATVNMMIQKVKKEPASIFNPTRKYKTTEKIEIWKTRTGISAVISAIQNAAGWYRANDLCFARMGRPEKEAVTSDIASKELKSKAKKSAPDLVKRPAELFGAL